MGRLKKLKKIRIHREGTHTLAGSLLLILAVNAGLYFGLECKIPFYVVAVISLVVYGILVNFFRCPIRLFGQENTEKIVVAPADGKIVVVEEVEETEYFHDRRIMVSIFMSLVNVHANWYPVDGTVKSVSHQNGKFMKAWLPKASTDNERSTVVIETPRRCGNHGTPDCRRHGTPYRNLCRTGRRVLYRRTYGLHQVRFACGCIPSAGYGSSC